MSNMVSFSSKNGDFIVIDLGLNIFLMNKKYQRDEVKFDQNILLYSRCIEELKNEIQFLQKQSPHAVIGIDMKYISSSEGNGAFCGFSKHIEDPSKVFFYNLQSASDLRERICSDIQSSGGTPVLVSDMGILFLADADNKERLTFPERCKEAIQSHLEEIVRGIVSERNPRELLSSSNVYADQYVDVKRLFLEPDQLCHVIYYMVRQLLNENLEYDALICTSKNGAVLASLIGHLLGKEVVYCINVGPQYALPARIVESSLQPEKQYVYIYDFVCLGTEAKLLHALIASHRATLVGGLGVASYIPLDNRELQEKSSPLANISSLVNLIKAKIPYSISVTPDGRT